MYEAFSYWCMRPSRTSVCGLKVDGFAGAVEAAITVLSLYHDTIPATANLDEPSEDLHPGLP